MVSFASALFSLLPKRQKETRRYWKKEEQMDQKESSVVERDHTSKRGSTFFATNKLCETSIQSTVKT